MKLMIVSPGSIVSFEVMMTGVSAVAVAVDGAVVGAVVGSGDDGERCRFLRGMFRTMIRTVARTMSGTMTLAMALCGHCCHG